ncbi:hypothetical protein L195_g027094 [Trifolium pratense]|uniref:RNase H type-1 domain-containing protein n=1 Tax=Trifolium pratense TaxID=57577 RepID=A0A2K3KY73_TRIPR|nr:hypothetical protein L195_g027094 [Trifolium pratense]
MGGGGKASKSIDSRRKGIFVTMSREHLFGIGMCIRGTQGIFMKAKTMIFYGSPPPLEAEAYALKEALIWLGELGLSRVDIELAAC